MEAVDRVPALWLDGAGGLFLKLSALVLMVADHVDWFLFDGSLGINVTLGRAVFPAFALVLGLNLARPGATDLWLRLLPRLVLFGALAHPAYTLLQGHALPLNVMATLAVGVAVVALLQAQRPFLAFLVFGWAGAGVDYAWFGVAAVVAVWALAARGYGYAAVAAAALVVVPFNGSWWSLALLPLVGLAICMHGSAPRLKWIFYAAYPIHLTLLAATLAG